MPVTDQYSGVVLNQNALSSGAIDWRGAYASQTIYQTFYLPSNYEVGSTEVEERYPDVSGFQVMVDVDSEAHVAASLGCTVDHYVIGSGWSNIFTGVVCGAHADGQIWMDIMLPQSITIDATLAASQFRLGVTTRPPTGRLISQPATPIAPGYYNVLGQTVAATLVPNVPYVVSISGVLGFLLLQDTQAIFYFQMGVGGLYYVSPNPLGAQGQAFQSDGLTPLLGTGTTASLNFRVLSLSADSGTDFLGNEYRSCLIQSNGTDTSTTTDTWSSPPYPSEFAVVSQYFDVRPAPAVPAIGTINLIPNPNFNYDRLGGTTPYGWTTVTGGSMVISNNWAVNSVPGTQSLRYTAVFTGTTTQGVLAPGTGTGGAAIVPNQSYSASVEVNVREVPTVGSLGIYINWYDTFGNFISATTGPTTAIVGIQSLAIIGATAPPSAAYGSLSIIWLGSTGNLDMSVSEVFLTQAATLPEYGDGDAVGWEWLGQPGESISAELVPVEAEDDAAVIDGILVDPSTPNMAFNVYYSVDDSGTSDNMTESQWEQKLWTRVPQIYIATQRQQYVFPAPVTAKYMKVEFTNLQAQTYNPGNFQQPVTYKKFPTWVADFFIGQLEAPSFAATQVNVQNDALNFAYAYYLDDLDESPQEPSSAPSSEIPNLTSFFSQSDAAGLVDATTLQSINLVMQSFQSPTGSSLNSLNLLGQYATTVYANQATTSAGTSEVPGVAPISYSTVSSITREPVVFEQSLPVMYFFLTCRHTYKELTASFDYNRAYFAGVNDIQFLRSNYETTTDTTLYIESGGDTYNAERNDFVIDTDSNWYAY